MKKRSLKITHIFNKICENLDQDLDSPRCREIKRHLAACGDCAAYLESLKRTIDLYRRYPAQHVSDRTAKKLRGIARGPY